MEFFSWNQKFQNQWFLYENILGFFSHCARDDRDKNRSPSFIFKNRRILLLFFLGFWNKDKGEELRLLFVQARLQLQCWSLLMITDDPGHALLPCSGYVICCPYVESVSSFLIPTNSVVNMKMHSRTQKIPQKGSVCACGVNSPFFLSRNYILWSEKRLCKREPMLAAAF